MAKIIVKKSYDLVKQVKIDMRMESYFCGGRAFFILGHERDGMSTIRNNS
jgi:hypothetical protein